MICGTAYGVVLNHRSEREALAQAFEAAPYKAPPQAPVMYIKPRGCLAGDGAVVRLDADLHEVEAAPTLGLLFGRDVYRSSPHEALGCVEAACLALDLSEPHASYYRPVVRQRCRDGFLPLGRPAAFRPPLLEQPIVARVGGHEALSWSPKDLVRDAATLVADISEFMTLRAGDLLLIGLPPGAPRLQRGEQISVSMEGLPSLRVSLASEVAA